MRPCVVLQTQEKCETENAEYRRYGQGCVNACTVLDLCAAQSGHELADLY